MAWNTYLCVYIPKGGQDFSARLLRGRQKNCSRLPRGGKIWVQAIFGFALAPLLVNNDRSLLHTSCHRLITFCPTCVCNSWDVGENYSAWVQAKSRENHIIFVSYNTDTMFNNTVTSLCVMIKNQMKQTGFYLEKPFSPIESITNKTNMHFVFTEGPYFSFHL